MRRLISLMRCFLEKCPKFRPPKTRFSKNFQKYYKKYYNFRTENAAPLKH